MDPLLVITVVAKMFLDLVGTTITTGTLSIGTNTDKNDSDNNIKIDTKNDSKMKSESEHNNCSSRKIKASM